MLVLEPLFYPKSGHPESGPVMFTVLDRGQECDRRAAGDPRAVGTRQVSDTEGRLEPSGRDEPSIAAVLEH